MQYILQIVTQKKLHFVTTFVIYYQLLPHIFNSISVILDNLHNKKSGN